MEDRSHSLVVAPPAVAEARSTGSPDLNRPDASDPNNEIVELSLNPSAGSSLDLTGHTLVNETGDAFNLPAGSMVSVGTPLRVYSGVGSNGPNEIYMGRSTPIWDNLFE